MCVPYPEGAVGYIDLTPGNNDGVFYGFDRSVQTQEGAVSLVCDLDIDCAALSILEEYKSTSAVSVYTYPDTKSRFDHLMHSFTSLPSN